MSSAETENSEEHLKKAKYYLDLNVCTAYKYILLALDKNRREFEKNCSKSAREKLDNGRFVGEYNRLRTEAKQLVRIGKRQQWIEAYNSFKDAYQRYSELNRMIDKQTPFLCLHGSHSTTSIAIAKWVVSIVISVVIGILIQFIIDNLPWIK